MRIGIYGGTFDPPHSGHLAVAEEARWALTLHQVLFVPAAVQPFKAGQQTAAPEQRRTMVELACADNPAFAVTTLELDRPPPSYTIDTLTELRRQFDPTTELFFLLGADAAKYLPKWHRAAEILPLARIAIIGRPGFDGDPAALDAQLPGLAANAVVIPGPELDISSTEIRRRIAGGQPVRYHLPTAVWQFIEREGLYR